MLLRPQYFGGSNTLDNLQTLCKTCNNAKGTTTINFLDYQTDLTAPLQTFPDLKMPTQLKAKEPGEWDHFLRRIINLFYRCQAVHDIEIAARGQAFYHWYVELSAGNDPEWMRPHIDQLLERICQAKEKAGFGAPQSITITAPGAPEIKAER